MSCICATLEYNPGNRQRATKRTRHAGQTGGLKPFYPSKNFVVRVCAGGGGYKTKITEDCKLENGESWLTVDI